MERYVIISLISMVFFGINAVVLKKASRIDPISLILLAMTTTTICIFLYWFFFAAKKEISLKGSIYALSAGAIYALGFITFIIALKAGKATVVMPLIALSSGVAVVLSIIFLSETLSIFQSIGIILAIGAAVLLSL